MESDPPENCHLTVKKLPKTFEILRKAKEENTHIYGAITPKVINILMQTFFGNSPGPTLLENHSE